MAFNDNRRIPLLAVVIGLSSLLLLSSSCGALSYEDIDEPVVPLISYISHSPNGAPRLSPSPSPAAAAGESDVEVQDLSRELAPSPGVPADIQEHVVKFVEKTVMAVAAKSDEFFRNVLKQRLSNDSECRKQCEENFDDAKDDAQNVLDALSYGDVYKAAVDVDAISTDIDTCNDCLKEDGLAFDPEIKKFHDWIVGITNDCLGALEDTHS